MFNGLKLTPEGRPLKPGSIFHGIRRINLPTEEEVASSLYSREQLAIFYRFCGQLEPIICTVNQVRLFTDGALLLLEVDTEMSPLKWPQAPIWIPVDNTQMAGILATWIH